MPTNPLILWHGGMTGLPTPQRRQIDTLIETFRFVFSPGRAFFPPRTAGISLLSVFHDACRLFSLPEGICSWFLKHWISLFLPAVSHSASFKAKKRKKEKREGWRGPPDSEYIKTFEMQVCDGGTLGICVFYFSSFADVSNMILEPTRTKSRSTAAAAEGLQRKTVAGELFWHSREIKINLFGRIKKIYISSADCIRTGSVPGAAGAGMK